MHAKDQHAMPVVRATFPDMAAARAAIDALQFAAIESSDISISGSGAENAERLARSRAGHSDAPIIWRVVWRGFWGSVAGAIVGVAAGFLFATSGLTLPGTSNSLLLQVVSWAMFLHVSGAIVGVYAGVTSGPAWELTFQPAAGPVTVAVRASNEAAIPRIERLLRKRGGTAVEAVATEAPN